MTSAPNQTAKRIFSPVGPSYERWARVLSLGQDGRWRRTMVRGLGCGPGTKVLDVAAGTGSITRLLRSQGHEVIAADLTPAMLAQHPGPHRVLGRGEQLPFADQSFDALTFGYLLRYVDDPVACLAEMRRVVKGGGVIGMVEFGLPAGINRVLWRFYAGFLLPMAGRLIGSGWYEVGKFLKPSIEGFHRANPNLEAVWRSAGVVDVRSKRLSLGGGLVMWGRRP